MQVQQTATVTSLQSLNLIQNILLSSIGCVSYVRGLFPDDSFETKGLDGIAVKVLKKDLSTEGNQLISWLETGCFDALKKQYLSTLLFGIYLNQDDPNDLVESYEFNFTYPSKDSYAFEFSSSSKEPSRAEVARTTHQLVRRLLVLTQSLEPLPEHAFITMRLYYTEDTPIEYEPPQFKACSPEDLPQSPVEGLDIKVGKVQTKHHEMSCKVTTRAAEIQQQHGADEDTTQDLINGLQPCSIEPTQTVEMNVSDDDEMMGADDDSHNEASLKIQKLPLQQQAKKVDNSRVQKQAAQVNARESLPRQKVEAAEYRKKPQRNVNATVVSPSTQQEISEEMEDSNDEKRDERVHHYPSSQPPKRATLLKTSNEWSCICNHSVLSNFPDTIDCSDCGKICHQVCYGVQSDDPDDPFLCKECTPMAKEADLYLLSLYRRTLSLLSHTEMPRSQIQLARLILSIKKDSEEAHAIVAPIYAFLLENGVVKLVKTREKTGKKRSTFPVNRDAIPNVFTEKLVYERNLLPQPKQIESTRKEQSQEDGGGGRAGKRAASESPATPELLPGASAASDSSPGIQKRPIAKRRKVSTVTRDLAVL